MSNDARFQPKARQLAEAVYEAYAQQASEPAQRMAEQTLVTRLVERLDPLAEAPASEQVAAANAVLADWEAREPDVTGPRVAAIDPLTGAVALAL